MNDAGKLRNDLLQAVQEAAKNYPLNLQAGNVLAKFKSQFSSVEYEQTVLTLWQDLFRTGYLAWGINLNNPDPPFFHLTARGKKSLEDFSRDPVNPIGYLAYVAKQTTLNSIAQSYLKKHSRPSITIVSGQLL